MIDEYPARRQRAQMAKSAPWSRWSATSALAASASARTMPAKAAGEAYLRVEVVVWMMTGDRASTAAATMACTISRFSALKAPTAHPPLCAARSIFSVVTYAMV